MSKDTIEGIKLALFALLAVTLIAGIMMLVGCGDELDKIPTDSLPEEVVESLLENHIEDKLGLPDDALKDKIDLSFWDGESER